MVSSLRTVTLEILRHGPPHNQLLSPLTQYLALCGNCSATTVTIPFEHNQLLVRLRALKYQDSPETTQQQFRDLSQIMANVLGGVPGLITGLTEGQLEKNVLTHVRLILSASELALLPFELANAPNGSPGEGQHLALQSQAPVCITREVRRVSNLRLRWPVKPMILFAAAAPPSGAPVPLEAHLLALRSVIEPWVRLDDSDEKDRPPPINLPDLKKKLASHLVFLPQASAEAIQQACATHDFTHVHLLAHGVTVPGEEERRYGLALHADQDPSKTDVVDGTRLATLLRTHSKGGVNVLSGPAVVTIASCESADQGSVVGAGASIAHALHEGGIPLVVGSQFPLSFKASVIMTEVLYKGFLWGEDPRTLLSDLRRQLQTKVPESHDWASLVAYAALPVDLDRQLGEIKFEQSRRSINVQMDYMDRETNRIRTKAMARAKELLKSPDAATRPDGPVAQMEAAREKVREAKQTLVQLLKEAPNSWRRSQIRGQLASTEKRDAKILYVAGVTHFPTRAADVNTLPYAVEATKALKRARDHYEQAFQEDRSATWALVQQLALTAVIEGPKEVKLDQWTTARQLCLIDVHASNRERTASVQASLLELYLLASIIPGHPHQAEAETAAKKHATDLAAMAGSTWELYATRRQIERYTDWFKDYGQGLEKLPALAQEIVNILSGSSSPPEAAAPKAGRRASRAGRARG